MKYIGKTVLVLIQLCIIAGFFAAFGFACAGSLNWWSAIGIMLFCFVLRQVTIRFNKDIITGS